MCAKRQQPVIGKKVTLYTESLSNNKQNIHKRVNAINAYYIQCTKDDKTGKKARAYLQAGKQTQPIIGGINTFVIIKKSFIEQ